MENFNAIFLEESRELLQKLETALLSLEKGASETGIINEIFRSMHTLKGNSGMFGFSRISEFVHNLETIYGNIRDGKTEISKELINYSLQSLDHIQNIIHDPDLKSENTRITHQVLTEKIKSLVIDSDSKQDVGNPTYANTVQSGLATFHIYFEPDENILKTGNNPLYLIDELSSMGSCMAIPHFKKINFFSDYDPQKCYTSWDIFISTQSTEKELYEVFIFVIESSILKIERLTDLDLVENREFRKKISSFEYTENKIERKDIEEFIGDSENEIIQLKNNTITEKKKGNSNAIHSIRVSSEKLDELMSLVSELITMQAGLSLYAENEQKSELRSLTENITKITKLLRDNAFGMTLIPLNNLFVRFERMVRDISSELKKEVVFETEGGETELDKAIIESLSDPIMHILRNSLDHGIETAAERKQNGKSVVGKIAMRAFYSGINVHIQIEDDGKGIDVSKIRTKAIEKKLISEEAVLSERDLLDLIFVPGFSTAEKVTDVSGRGVGMDVVRKNISGLRGEIMIASTPGQGTILTIKLPLTLSTIDGLLVKVADTSFVIPLSIIGKCYEIQSALLENNFHELLMLDGDAMPYINLRKQFDITEKAKELIQVIVVKNEEREVGLTVDEIIGEYQAVIKPLGKYYRQQDFISGATILGDGSIALVLDTNRIINQFTKNQLSKEML